MSLRDWFTSGGHRAATDLGNVLLTLGLVTGGQLAEAVRRQVELTQKAKADLRLGQILVSMGALTPEMLATALAKQREMRRGRATETMVDVVSERWSVVQDALGHKP